MRQRWENVAYSRCNILYVVSIHMRKRKKLAKCRKKAGCKGKRKAGCKGMKKAGCK